MILSALLALVLMAPASAFAFPGSLDRVQTIPDLSALFVSDRDAEDDEKAKETERDAKDERKDGKERPRS